jgi:hypothetical protein
VKRGLYGVVFGLMALVPISAAADASPTPNLTPSLDQTLAPAPSGYTTPVKGPYSGAMDASQFALTWGTKSATAESELDRDGFVAAYGTMFADRTASHVMAEFVIAFTGQSGALRYLGADKTETELSDQFQHIDTANGLGPYYFGVHETQASPPVILDGFEFVKGNDLFGVGFYSTKDDVVALATTQAQKQFDLAPAQTISSNDWPENQAPPSRDTGLGDMGQPLLIAAVVIVVLGGAGVFLLMRRGETARPAPALTQEMSPDGNFWWGGSSWVSSADVAPPWAQRSPDGGFWWDGHAWRPVPGAAPVAPR